jgi:DMATS type aromatic prenyltransferase
LLQVFDDLTPWARSPALWDSAYRSSVADDGAPFEFCMAFGSDRAPEVQVYVEPLGEPPSLRSNLQRARGILDHLSGQYDIALGRLAKVQDLAFPESPEGTFTLWIGASWTSRRPVFLKCYLNPQVSGLERSAEVTAEVLERLGHGNAWRTVAASLAQSAQRRDELAIISLDLHSSPEARTKVYIRHHHASVADLDESVRLASDYQPGDAERFYGSLSGDSATRGAFFGKPPIVEFAFVNVREHRQPFEHIGVGGGGCLFRRRDRGGTR